MSRHSHRALVMAGALLAVIGSTAAASSRATLPALRTAADSVTGCLQKGSTPGTFTLVGKDGKSTDVTSQKVALAGHVGHMVTLTGNTMTSSAGSMGGMKDSAMSKMGDSSKMGGASMNKGGMDVTQLSMVSASCK